MSLRRSGLLSLLLLTARCAPAAQTPVYSSSPPPTGTVAGASTPEKPGSPATQPASEGATEGAKSSGANDAAPPPPPPATASVVTGALGGAITQAEIRQVVVKNGALFDACYKIGAGTSHKFIATVTVRATVGRSGHVNAAEVIKSTAKNAKVDACVAEAFKKMQFPSPQGGATSVITFPIEFEGVEEVIN